LGNYVAYPILRVPFPTYWKLFFP